jgi:tagatose 1,6-diphosphate aldolase GatY/KbaY
MRTRFSELLRDAAARGGAVGAFTCYNLETALGVLDAAGAATRGVALLISPQSFAGAGGEALLAALSAATDAAAAPACVQLDHATDAGAIRRAFMLGAGAVLADGSRLSLEQNIQFVEDAGADGEVEAELGRIEGDEDVAAAVAAGALTEPHEAARLAEEARPTCLAVSIGNVHGRYRMPPRLDWDRLQAVRERVDVPLSLHGASGLPDEDVRRAIELGVRKVNVNTELREAYLAATAERLEGARVGARVLELNRAQATAVADVVARKLELLG